MAEVTEKNVRNMEELLFIFHGEDIGGRIETQESGALATHESCLGCNENRPRWGYCPACGDTGIVRSRSGDYDPYLVRYGREDKAIERTTLATYAVPSPSPHRPTPTGEHIPLTTVERSVAQRIYLWGHLRWLRRRLRTAPAFVREGALTIDRDAVEWLVKRARNIPDLA